MNNVKKRKDGAEKGASETQNAARKVEQRLREYEAEQTKEGGCRVRKITMLGGESVSRLHMGKVERRGTRSVMGKDTTPKADLRLSSLLTRREAGRLPRRYREGYTGRTRQRWKCSKGSSRGGLVALFAKR